MKNTIPIAIVSLAPAFSFFVFITGCHSGYRCDTDAPDQSRIAKSYRAPAETVPEQVVRNTESYDHIVENRFHRVTAEPLSTFSIDVDTAAYSNVRRMLNGGQLPPAGAVRIEELINYFDYDYPGPSDRSAHPFGTSVEIATCPWKANHRLARIGMRGKTIESKKRPPCNLVFLLDVSGSMKARNKLPLVKKAMTMLVKKLNGRDRVAIVVYAGAAGMVLDSTPANESGTIIAAMDRLAAGGSTNGGQGIDLAYKTAIRNKIHGGINRVILCTDGDFNVGNTSRSGLVALVRKHTRNGVYLTALGFGMGNYKDDMMEEISNRGNGTAAYIDSESEAKKVLVDEINSTLMTIARDVKIQVEFNPAIVGAYRLIGYENRMLSKEDFNDDTKDAGEIGAGHTVTAVYELIPAGEPMPTPQVDTLKYQKIETGPSSDAHSGEAMTLKLRYKDLDAEKSTKITIPVRDGGGTLDQSSEDFRFAASVAAFGMLLRGSAYAGNFSLNEVLELASAGIGRDARGYRKEFVGLVKKAKALKGRQASSEERQ